MNLGLIYFDMLMSHFSRLLHPQGNNVLSHAVKFARAFKTKRIDIKSDYSHRKCFLSINFKVYFEEMLLPLHKKK